MNTHHMQLEATPFEAIVSRHKTIESRLYDEKRQRIQIGDRIIFTNREDPTRAIMVRVINLLRHDTFHELFSCNNPEKFGGKDVEWLENQINEFYSTEDQLNYGVVGIEFEICNSQKI